VASVPELPKKIELLHEEFSRKAGKIRTDCTDDHFQEGEGAPLMPEAFALKNKKRDVDPNAKDKEAQYKRLQRADQKKKGGGRNRARRNRKARLHQRPCGAAKHTKLFY